VEQQFYLHESLETENSIAGPDIKWCSIGTRARQHCLVRFAWIATTHWCSWGHCQDMATATEWFASTWFPRFRRVKLHLAVS